MKADVFSCPIDKAKIYNQFLQIEFMRDFIVWLCEEECDSTVREMEDSYNKWKDKQDTNQINEPK